MTAPPVTRRLYLEDPERHRFRARVVERTPLAAGGIALVLQQTCFYPTSGGQPHDTGWIGGADVFDVQEDAAGRVVHHVRTDPGGDEVDGEVDGERRRHHMQQHSGQHLLSATCVALLQRDTVSFHLGDSRCSIDLPGPVLDGATLQEVERRANAVVWESRPVHARVLAREELPALRKPPPQRPGPIRIVEIDGWDCSPCCGTHVARTSEIGLIKILGQERVRDGARLHFLCGARALAELWRCLERQDELSHRLTCHPDALLGRVEALQEESKRLHRELAAAERELASWRAAAWIATAPRLAGRPVVVQTLAAPEATTLALLATALVARGAIALLGAAGERAQLLFAAPEDAGADLRPVLQAACAAIDGRGGGVAARVQGSGPRADGLEAALAAAVTALRAQLFPRDL